MSKAPRKFSKVVLAFSFMFALALSPAILAGGKSDDGSSSGVLVLEHTADGPVVHVKVKNTSRSPQTVNVYVDAVVGTMNVRGFTPVFVTAGGTADTVVGFSAEVSAVEGSGIIESGNPN